VVSVIGMQGLQPHGYRRSASAPRSGGQVRRLALAWLVLRDPRIVLLDEPFSNLDEATAGRVLTRLRPWLEQRRAVIVTHAPEHLPAEWPRLPVSRPR
jgi:ATP-binding cassette, subfamily C, bacterial CydC